MSTFLKVHDWLEKNDLPFTIPQLDSEKGLSRFVVDKLFLVHVLATPKPRPQSEDRLFLYVPLINIASADEVKLKKFFYYINAQHMPAKLPSDFRFAVGDDKSFCWLIACIDTEYMDAHSFSKKILAFIACMRTQAQALRDLLEREVAYEVQASEDGEISIINLMTNQNIVWG